MINLIANEKFKNLGCKWDREKSEWIPPAIAKDKFDEIKKEFYDDMINVEITVHPYKDLKSQEWGYSHVMVAGGYILATVKGRDWGAKIMDGVAVIKGKFFSGGSMKNPRCLHDDGIVFRLTVSRNALKHLDAENNIYTYTIIG